MRRQKWLFWKDRSNARNLHGSWSLINFSNWENTTLTGGVVVFSLPFRCSSREKGYATSHPGWMFNPAHRLSNRQQLLIVFSRWTTETSKQTISKSPRNIPFLPDPDFQDAMRCGAVRCDAMRGHAMQGHAITTSVWAMYRNQYRILYALPGKHDTGMEIEFCDRSFHLSNVQGDAASNWNCFGLGSWVALLLMQSWIARFFFFFLKKKKKKKWCCCLMVVVATVLSLPQKQSSIPPASLTHTAIFCVVLSWRSLF